MKELSSIETSLVSGGLDMDSIEFAAFFGLGAFLGTVFGASVMTGISLVSSADGSPIICKSITYAIGAVALGTLPGAYIGMLLNAIKY